MEYRFSREGEKNMKLKGYIVANALAGTTAIVFVVCRILVGFFPDASFAVVQSWFHGIELSKLSTWNLTTSVFVLGLVSSTITAWVIGYIYTKVHNALAK